MKERVFGYRALEREVVATRKGMRVLDVGCGAGDNLRRLVRYGGKAMGIDPSLARVQRAQSYAPAAVARGEALPYTNSCFEMVYISHVLHHALDVGAVLRESHRVLVSGGLLFLLESVEDSPLMRLARAVQPRWKKDEVTHRFRFAQLERTVRENGFEIRDGATFNWIYFLWELLPLAFRPFEVFTPLAIGLETALRKPLDRFGGHCWLVAQKPGESVVADLPSLISTVRRPQSRPRST
jgi:SAM-dependent methyltransferase